MLISQHIDFDQTDQITKRQFETISNFTTQAIAHTVLSARQLKCVWCDFGFQNQIKDFDFHYKMFVVSTRKNIRNVTLVTIFFET